MIVVIVIVAPVNTLRLVSDLAGCEACLLELKQLLLIFAVQWNSYEWSIAWQ